MEKRVWFVTYVKKPERSPPHIPSYKNQPSNVVNLTIRLSSAKTVLNNSLRKEISSKIENKIKKHS